VAHHGRPAQAASYRAHSERPRTLGTPRGGQVSTNMTHHDAMLLLVEVPVDSQAGLWELPEA